MQKELVAAKADIDVLRMQGLILLKHALPIQLLVQSVRWRPSNDPSWTPSAWPSSRDVRECARLLPLEICLAVQAELADLKRQADHVSAQAAAFKELQATNSTLTRTLVLSLKQRSRQLMIQAVSKITLSDFERDVKFEREKNASLQRQALDLQQELEKVRLSGSATDASRLPEHGQGQGVRARPGAGLLRRETQDAAARVAARCARTHSLHRQSLERQIRLWPRRWS